MIAIAVAMPSDLSLTFDTFLNTSTIIARCCVKERQINSISQFQLSHTHVCVVKKLLEIKSNRTQLFVNGSKAKQYVHAGILCHNPEDRKYCLGQNTTIFLVFSDFWLFWPLSG